MIVNYGSVSGQVVEYGYTGAYTGGVTYPYVLTSHGVADTNSFMANANFATTGTVDLRIISDFDSAKVVVDWQAISDGQLWRQDVNTLTAVGVISTTDTTTAATLGWRVPDGTTGQFDVTLQINADGTVVDATPDAFTLTDQTSVEPGVIVESNAITIAGVTSNAEPAASVTGGEYAVDAGAGFGAYTTASTPVQLGYRIKVRQTASASFSTATSATLTVGGVSDTFTVTTRAQVPPVLDSAVPDLSLEQGDPVSLDLSAYFAGASSYSLTGLPAGTGLTFFGSQLTGNASADDAAASPFNLTATATNTDGSTQDIFAVTVTVPPPPPPSVPGSGRRGFLRPAVRGTVNSIIGSIIS